MAVDTSILSRIQPPQPVALSDPLERYGKSLTLKNLMMQGDQQQQAFDDDRAVRDAYAQSGGDSATLRSLLTNRGSYKQIQALDKFELEKREKEAGIVEKTAKGRQANATALEKSLQTHRDQLANVNDPLAAIQWLSAGYRDPELGPILSRAGSLEDVASKIPQDQKAFNDWRNRNALGLEKFLEQQNKDAALKETARGHDLTNTAALRGQDLTRLSAREGHGVTMRGQDIGAATTRRGQDLTNTRETDPVLAGRLAEARAGGKERGESQAQATIRLPQATADAERALRLVDELVGSPDGKTKPHAGFKTAVGVSGIGGGFGAAGFVPGTDTSDFKRRFEELKGGQFLQAFESLKGGGAITEIEGKKATDAISRMNLSQSEGEFVTAARDFQSTVKGIMGRLKQKAGQGGGGANPSNLSDAELLRELGR